MTLPFIGAAASGSEVVFVLHKIDGVVIFDAWASAVDYFYKRNHANVDITFIDAAASGSKFSS